VLDQILRHVRSFEFGHLQNSGDLSMEYAQYFRAGPNFANVGGLQSQGVEGDVVALYPVGA